MAAQDTVQLRLTVRDEVTRALNQMSAAMRAFDQSVNFSHARNEMSGLARVAERMSHEVGSALRLMGASTIVGGGVVATLGLMANQLKNFAQSGLQLHYTAREFGLATSAMHQYTAALEAMGVPHEQAASDIKNVMNALIDLRQKGQESSTFTELAKSAGGVDLAKQLIGAVNLEDAFKLLLERMARLKPDEGGGFLKRLFGASSLAIGDSVKLWGTMREAIEPNAPVMRTFMKSWIDLGTSMGNVQTRLGAAILPSFEKMFTKLNEWMQSPEGDQFLKKLEGWAGDFADEIDRFTQGKGKLYDAWLGLAEVIGYLKTEFKAADAVIKDMGLNWPVVIAGLVTINLSGWLVGVGSALLRIVNIIGGIGNISAFVALLTAMENKEEIREALRKDREEAAKQPGRAEQLETLKQHGLTAAWAQLFKELFQDWMKGNFDILGHKNALPVPPMELPPVVVDEPQKFTEGEATQLGVQDEKFIDFLNGLKVNMDALLENSPESQNIEDRRGDFEVKGELRDNFQILRDELLRLNNILIGPGATPSDNITGIEDPYGTGTINAGGPGSEFPEDIKKAGIHPVGTDEQLVATMLELAPGGHHLSPAMRSGIQRLISETDPATVLERMQTHHGMSRALAFGDPDPPAPPTGTFGERFGRGATWQEGAALAESLGGARQYSPEITESLRTATPSTHVTGLEDPYGTSTINLPTQRKWKAGDAPPLGFFKGRPWPVNPEGATPLAPSRPGSVFTGVSEGRGVASWYGNRPQYGFVDRMDKGVKGIAESQQGISLSAPGTKGQYHEITDPFTGLTHVARQTDTGPGVRTQKMLDIHASQLIRMGYTGERGANPFPTGKGLWDVKPAGFEKMNFLSPRGLSTREGGAGAFDIEGTDRAGGGFAGQAPQPSLAPVLAEESARRSIDGNAAIDINVKNVRGGSGSDQPDHLFRDVPIERAGQMENTGGNGKWTEDSGLNYE